MDKTDENFLKDVKEHLSYNPDTGLFIHIKKRGSSNVDVGSIAGTLSKGYIKLVIKGRIIPAHQMAFYYMTGVLEKYIDHKNGIASDNRWCNLRLSNTSHNSTNIVRAALDTNKDSTKVKSETGLRYITKLNSGKVRVKIKRQGVLLIDRVFEDLELAKAFRNEWLITNDYVKNGHTSTEKWTNKNLKELEND